MDFSVSHRKQVKKRKNRFQKLWQRAERQQNENERLNRSLDKLLNRLHKEVVPVQVELGRTGRDLILHLLPFLRRRSLTNWQRTEIPHWIEEQLALIIPMGLMDEVLQEALARDSALQMGLTIDEQSPLSAHEQVEAAIQAADAASNEYVDSSFETLVDEEVDRLVKRKFGGKKTKAPVEDLFQAELDDAERAQAEEMERFRQQAKEDLRDEMETEFERLLGNEFDAFFDENSVDGKGNGSQAPVPNNELFDRLFRRTANVLHPDKEQDDARRDEKHALMGALLEARKKGDILTIFKLHHAHVGAESGIDAEDEKQLLDALEQQVELLNNEKDEIINQSPAHANAYHHFYASTRKKVDKNIAEYINQSRQHCESLRTVIHEVKTLKALKPLLEQHYRERRFGFAGDVIF